MYTSFIALVLRTESTLFEDITVTLTFVRSVADGETGNFGAASPHGMGSSPTLIDHDGSPRRKAGLQLGAS